MHLNQQLQQLNNQLDKQRHKLTAAQQRGDAVTSAKFSRDIEVTEKAIAAAKSQKSHQLSSKGAAVKKLGFSRILTKAEQADLGKLKKSVRGLMVVHPLTALGRELNITEVTGFAPATF